VLAGQVAAPDQVPDHHRPGWITLRPERRRVFDFLHVLRYPEHFVLPSKNHFTGLTGFFRIYGINSKNYGFNLVNPVLIL
jgi:hypothetical protein